MFGPWGFSLSGALGSPEEEGKLAPQGVDSGCRVYSKYTHRWFDVALERNLEGTPQALSSALLCLWSHQHWIKTHKSSYQTSRWFTPEQDGEPLSPDACNRVGGCVLGGNSRASLF